MKFAATVLTAFAILSQPVWAAKPKKDFAAFKGTYTGTSSLTYNGITGTGNVTATIAVPKNGRTATVTLQGALIAFGAPNPFLVTITMVNGLASMNDISIGLGSGTLYPAAGTYANNSAKLFTFNAAGVGSAVCSVSVKPIGKKKKRQTITINYTVINGSPYVFSFVATGKAPKLPKE